MARLLEELQPGTPALDRDGARVGEVRRVYASGAARGAEFILLYWDARSEEALVPADDVSGIDDDGVHLMNTGAAYATLAAFDPAANPALHAL